MVLPTGVLVYKVLNSANIFPEKKHVIRATLVTLTFESMTKQLKAIYNNPRNSVNSNDNFDIKCKPVYYANRSLDCSQSRTKR